MFRKNAPIEFVKSCPLGVRFPEVLRLEVAFTGRSNVGKSSLINSLTQIKGLARVSNTPGRTQAVNWFRVDGKFWLVDLPGYGFARVPRAMVEEFRELMQDYFNERAAWMIGVQIIDSRRGVMDLDREMMALFRHHSIPFLVAATKIDKLKKQERVRALSALRRDPDLTDLRIIPFAAPTTEGRAELLKALTELADARSISSQTVE